MAEAISFSREITTTRTDIELKMTKKEAGKLVLKLQRAGGVGPDPTTDPELFAIWDAVATVLAGLPTE